MSREVLTGRGWWVARQLEHLILGYRFEMRRTSGHVFLTSLLILLRARRADAATENSPEFSNKGTLHLSGCSLSYYKQTGMLLSASS